MTIALTRKERHWRVEADSKLISHQYPPITPNQYTKTVVKSVDLQTLGNLYKVCILEFLAISGHFFSFIISTITYGTNLI